MSAKLLRVATLAATLIACNSKAPPPSPAPSPPAPKSEPVVHVDRRVELVSIVFRLAGAREYNAAAPTPYLTDVDRTFAAFAQHPVIALTRALIAEHGIGFDAPMDLAVHLDDQLVVHGTLEPRWASVDVAAYLVQLRAFAADTKLDAFLAAHHAYIAAVEDRFRSALVKEDAGSWFASMFGPGSHFVVVPGLVEGPTNYGTHDDHTMFQIMGLETPPADGLPIIDEEMIETLVHEMAHSFVNPVFDRHPELEAAAAPLFPFVQREMTAQAYPTTPIMLDESGVRAVTVLYVRERKGKDAAVLATLQEVRRGFVWTSELADVLARYHASGSTNFETAVPGVVALFADFAKRSAHGLPPHPFLGPINAVFGSKVAIVHANAPAVATYAKAIHDQLLRSAQLAVSSANTFSAFPNTALAAYGTASSNTVIAEVLARSKITIDASGVTLGTKAFTGAGLVVMACWPRADAPTYGIVIYAAARDADVVGINNVRAGGTDWVVARRRADGGFDTLATGDFNHAPDGTWLLP